MKKKGKQKIVISGYYGFSNIGDEAVLQALVEGLKSELGDSVEIIVLSASPEQTAGVYGVNAFFRTSVGEVSKALRECDLLISGGGSLLQDATSLRSLVYYLGVIRQAKRFGRRVIILGQGIGPLRRGISRFLTRRVLNRVDSIAVRDSRSASLLEEIGVRRPPIMVTADLTFLLKPCSRDKAGKLLSESGINPENDVVAVALRNWRESPEFENATANALRTLAADLPANILLLTMQKPDDVHMARQIEQTVGMPERVFLQPKEWSAAEYLGVIEKCGLVLGMRLHSLIFAASVGTPSVGITYDPKVGEFQDAAGQHKMSLSEVDSGLLAERVIKAWNEKEELSKKLTETVPAMKRAAAENIRLAVEQMRSLKSDDE